jgi:hypothetical protein
VSDSLTLDGRFLQEGKTVTIMMKRKKRYMTFLVSPHGMYHHLRITKIRRCFRGLFNNQFAINQGFDDDEIVVDEKMARFPFHEASLD